jgi:hypothetical protein
MRALILAAALSPIVLWASAWAGEEPAKGEAKPEKKDAEPEEVLKKMQRPVSFDFTETPFVEAVTFINSLSRACMIVDPKLAAEGNRPITMKMKDTALRTALDQIAQTAGAGVYYCDGAYWISKNPPEEVTLTLKPKPPLTEEQSKAALQAVSELGSDKYQTREAASEKLRKLDAVAGVSPVIEEALKAEKSDEERKMRLTKLVEELRGELSPELAKRLHRTVSFCFCGDEPLSEVLSFFTSLSGVEMIAEPALREAKLCGPLRLTGQRMDHALRWVARFADANIVYCGDKIKLAKKQK